MNATTIKRLMTVAMVVCLSLTAIGNIGCDTLGLAALGLGLGDLGLGSGWGGWDSGAGDFGAPDYGWGGGYGPIDEDVFQNAVNDFSDYIRS